MSLSAEILAAVKGGRIVGLGIALAAVIGVGAYCSMRASPSQRATGQAGEQEGTGSGTVGAADPNVDPSRRARALGSASNGGGGIGTRDSVNQGGGSNAAPSGPAPVPCTSAPCAANSVPCSGKPGGVCTVTEAKIIQHDIDVNHASSTTPASCYSCLQEKLILNDPKNGVVNQECQDLTSVINPVTGRLNTPADVDHCLNIVDCILSSRASPDAGPGGPNCAEIQANLCYCGSADVATNCQTGAANGVCLAEYQMAAGSATPAQIVFNLGNTSTPWGNATNLVIGAQTAGCPACLTSSF